MFSSVLPEASNGKQGASADAIAPSRGGRGGSQVQPVRPEACRNCDSLGAYCERPRDAASGEWPLAGSIWDISVRFCEVEAFISAASGMGSGLLEPQRGPEWAGWLH